MSGQQILVVEDDPLTAKVLTARLRDQGYEVAAARDVPEASHLIRTRRPDLMILDLTLRDGDREILVTNGLGFLTLLRQSRPEFKCPVIIYSVDTSAKVQSRAATLGVSATINKAGPLAELLSAVRRALEEAPPAERPIQIRASRAV
jgi:two-component system, NtrC family, nitrogen regulation response regulator NtrX